MRIIESTGALPHQVIVSSITATSDSTGYAQVAITAPNTTAPTVHETSFLINTDAVDLIPILSAGGMSVLGIRQESTGVVVVVTQDALTPAQQQALNNSGASHITSNSHPPQPASAVFNALETQINTNSFNQRIQPVNGVIVIALGICTPTCTFSPTAAPTATPTTPVVTVGASSSSAGGGGNMIMFIIIAVVAVLLIAVIAFFVVKKKGADDGGHKSMRNNNAMENPLYDGSGFDADAARAGHLNNPVYDDEPDMDPSGPYMDVDADQAGMGYLDVAGEGTYDELPPSADADLDSIDSDPEEGTYDDTVAYDSQEADQAFANDNAIDDDEGEF